MVVIANLFDIDGYNYVLESAARNLFTTNLFAARNIVKPYDWEAYESVQSAAASTPAVEYVKALYDYNGSNDLELTFTAGTQLQLLEKVDSDWWWCDLNDIQGYVPSTYVEIVKAPAKTSKKSTFTTIKRGTEIEALMATLLKLAPKGSDKVPKDSFLQWALDHEMDRCLDKLEKEFDLRPPRSAGSTSQRDSKDAAPATTQQSALQQSPSNPAIQPAPMSTPVVSQSTAMAPSADPAAQSMKNPGERDTAPKISPELALVLRAAGIADKELDDNAMSEFVNYFIDKHAPKMAGAEGTKKTAARRKKTTKPSKIDDTVHRRPLPALAATSTPATSSFGPPLPAATSSSTSTQSTDAVSSTSSLHEQIKAGKKLRPSRKKTNLATLSKKDLTGLGLLLRTQIDSRRNIMMMSDDEDSSNSDFDD